MKSTDKLPIYARKKCHTIHGHLIPDEGQRRGEALMELVLEAVRYGRDHDVIAFDVCERRDGIEVRVAYQPRGEEFENGPGRLL